MDVESTTVVCRATGGIAYPNGNGHWRGLTSDGKEAGSAGTAGLLYIPGKDFSFASQKQEAFALHTRDGKVD